MSDAITLAPLTADDIAALRAAESVSFHHYQGRSYIRATMRNNDGRIFSAREQRLFPQTDRMDRDREISAAASAFGYGERDGNGGWRMDQAPNLTAFAWVSSASVDRAWQTIASLLRKGDTLTLQWVADNNADVHRDAGMHVDVLEMHVARDGRTTPLVFEVAHQTGLDNSARMIRRHG